MGSLSGKEIVFHFGAHKTASTSMQRLFQMIAQAEPTRAYFGPAEVRRAESPLKALTTLGRLRTPQKLVPALVEEALDGLEQVPQSSILISDENMLGPLIGVSTRLYPAAKRAAAVAAGARRRGARVKGVLFVREQTSLLQSAYLFRVSRGVVATPEQFLAGLQVEGLSWLPVARALLVGVGPSLSVVPHEALSEDLEGVCTVLAKTHPWFRRLDELHRSNVSVRGLPLFIVQQLRIYGLRIPPKRIPRLCREMGTRIEQRGLFAARKLRQLENVACELLAGAIERRPDGWRYVVRQAIRTYVHASANGPGPLEFSGSLRTLLRAHYREDNEQLFAEHIARRWRGMWRCGRG